MLKLTSHTLSRKPGALRNSLAIKADPRLKDIFDTYYKEKPRAFIELIREYRDLDNDSLININIYLCIKHQFNAKIDLYYRI